MYLVRIAVSAGSFATSCVTMTFFASAETICFDWWSILRSMSVTRRPNDAALVTSLPPIWQMYGWCVCALITTLTRGSRPLAIAVTSLPLKLTHLLTST